MVVTWRTRAASPNVLHMSERWNAWPLGIRWLVCAVVAVVLGLVIAWVLFVPAADWLAHQDVGSTQGPLLQTARETETILARAAPFNGRGSP